MKKHILRPALLALTGLLFTAVHAQENPTQATITAVKGSAQVRQPDGSSGPATVGMKLSQGAVITTGSNAQVAIEAHPGIVAVVAGSSRVELEKLSVNANGMRNTMMNLTTGSLGSSLDPAKKSVNNYGVRTAKGVAMAHGTTMTVTVDDKVYTVSVLAGTVTVNWTGGLSVSIVGNTPSDVTSNGQSAGSLHDALAAGNTPGLMDALTAAAAAVGTVATNTLQITAVIDAIATAAGTNIFASATVAGATAAAIGAAVTNLDLVPLNSGTGVSVASTISSAAVKSSTAAGNGVAAELILVSSGNAVVNSVAGSKLNDVAKSLTDASNSVSGNPNVKASEVISGVNAPLNPGTPLTAIDPSINVSRSS